ncbi:Endonuclease/exonuclease/phosphatase [Artemisia annua]|uniref:Endonuclease/exonuclease/phosphatase n=1 Tax=Artemisia annua TaxID=35608 RepID=A0A2U1MRI9_ARTAN|nr:Endonuclease/exonuclease/phosphatase [Artemisia annua]
MEKGFFNNKNTTKGTTSAATGNESDITKSIGDANVPSVNASSSIGGFSKDVPKQVEPVSFASPSMVNDGDDGNLPEGNESDITKSIGDANVPSVNVSSSIGGMNLMEEFWSTSDTNVLNTNVTTEIKIRKSDLLRCIEDRDLKAECGLLTNTDSLAREAAIFELMYRVKWAVDGDENSRYFHASIKKRAVKHHINGLSWGGNWITLPDAIKGVAFSHFQDPFKEPISARPRFRSRVGSLKAMNLSLLGKWRWRFLNEQEALWRKVISVLFDSDGGFKNIRGAELKKGIWDGIILSAPL